jgi:hypothetical protein
MNVFTIKQGDTHRRLQLTLSSLTTTGASGVSFRGKQRDGALKFTRAGVIDSSSQVSCQFQASDINTPGTFDVEATLTYPGSEEETVPTEGYVTMVVLPRLA